MKVMNIECKHKLVGNHGNKVRQQYTQVYLVLFYNWVA